MKRAELFITLGLPASGKTYFTDRLAAALGLHHLNTDKLRLTMIEKPTFSPEENAHVYKEMTRLARERLARGESLICNGNYNQRIRRQAMRNMAKKLNARCITLYVDTPVDIVRDRIQTRDHEIPVEKMVHQPLELLERMQKAFEAPTGDELVIRIDGTLPYDQQLASFHAQHSQL